MKTTKRLMLAAVAIATTAGVSLAQSYYDDDIYFNPSKDKDKNIEQTKKTVNETSAVVYRQVTTDYPAADTYTVETSSTRDIDEYNRRGIFSTVSTEADTTVTTGDFENTRIIEKYYNPNIITDSNDSDLVELYYAEPAEVNIYLTIPGYWGWNYPLYSSYWGWSSLYWGGWYNPWSWAWGPAWNWSWAWSPAWSPAWSWGWGPSWSWGGPAYNNPRHPGAGRQPVYSRSGNSLSRSSVSSGRTGRQATTTRTTGRRPGISGNNSTSRSSNIQGTQNSNQQNNSYTRPGRNNSNPTYNQGSTNSSRSGFSSGGGSRSSGGSSGRGRH